MSRLKRPHRRPVAMPVQHELHSVALEKRPQTRGVGQPLAPVHRTGEQRVVDEQDTNQTSTGSRFQHLPQRIPLRLSHTAGGKE